MLFICALELPTPQSMVLLVIPRVREKSRSRFFSTPSHPLFVHSTAENINGLGLFHPREIQSPKPHIYHSVDMNFLSISLRNAGKMLQKKFIFMLLLLLQPNLFL